MSKQSYRNLTEKDYAWNAMCGMLSLPLQCQIEMFEVKQEQSGIDDVLRSMY